MKIKDHFEPQHDLEFSLKLTAQKEVGHKQRPLHTHGRVSVSLFLQSALRQLFSNRLISTWLILPTFSLRISGEYPCNGGLSAYRNSTPDTPDYQSNCTHGCT